MSSKRTIKKRKIKPKKIIVFIIFCLITIGVFCKINNKLTKGAFQFDYVPKELVFTQNDKCVYSSNNKQKQEQIQNFAYYSNVTFDEIKQYIEILKKNNVKYSHPTISEQQEIDKYGIFTWYGTNKEETLGIIIMYFDKEQVTIINDKEIKYNLDIQLNNYNIYDK